MLNFFQHLGCFFLPSADASFILVQRTGFSDALLIKNPPFPFKEKEGESKRFITFGHI
jgi:hypothetical protein